MRAATSFWTASRLAPGATSPDTLTDVRPVLPPDVLRPAHHDQVRHGVELDVPAVERADGQRAQLVDGEAVLLPELGQDLDLPVARPEARGGAAAEGAGDGLGHVAGAEPLALGGLPVHPDPDLLVPGLQGVVQVLDPGTSRSSRHSTCSARAASTSVLSPMSRTLTRPPWPHARRCRHCTPGTTGSSSWISSLISAPDSWAPSEYGLSEIMMLFQLGDDMALTF
jgi:hypothetical protein